MEKEINPNKKGFDKNLSSDTLVVNNNQTPASGHIPHTKKLHKLSDQYHYIPGGGEINSREQITIEGEAFTVAEILNRFVSGGISAIPKIGYWDETEEDQNNMEEVDILRTAIDITEIEEKHNELTEKIKTSKQKQTKQNLKQNQTEDTDETGIKKQAEKTNSEQSEK